MKKILVILLLLPLLFIKEASGKWLTQKKLYSKALQQEKTWFIGLPDGYNPSDKTRKYPVIIFLHGASVTASEIANSFDPFFDNLVTRLLFPNLFKVIFVIPDGSSPPYKGSFYTNSALYGKYEDYIAGDLTEEVANNYNTYSSREKWCIMGHSMGGYGAMKIALKHAGKFMGVSALSGPLNITYYNDLLPMLLTEHGTAPPYTIDYSGDVTMLFYSMSGAFSPAPGETPPVRLPVDASGNVVGAVRELWDKQNPINLIRGWQGKPAMAIHLYCGGKDEYKLAQHNRMFSDTLKKYNLPHTYSEDPLGDHVTSLFTSLPQGVNFLYHVMDTAKIRNTTLVQNAEMTEAWSVFPNPASDRFYVSGQGDGPLQVAVYNLSGQKVLQIENSHPYAGININPLSGGTYLILLKTVEGNQFSEKLIKK